MVLKTCDKALQVPRHLPANYLRPLEIIPLPALNFFQLVLRKMPGKRHQFPSPLPSLTSWNLLASLLLLHQDKLDPFPECVHLLIHLPATLNPQKGDS